MVKELQKRLSKLKIKLMLELWLKSFLKFAVIGVMIAILYAVASKWKYIADKTIFFTVLFLLVLLFSLLYCFMKRISWKKTAQIADELGYEERFITAWEILQNNKEHSKIEQLVIDDAISKANADISKQYHINIPKKQIQMIVVLFAVFFLTSMINTTQQQEAEQYAFAQLKKIEEVKNEINKEQDIDEEALQAFNKEINHITKNLKKAQTVEESKKMVEQAQQAVKALEKNSVHEDLKKMAEVLSQNEKTKGLADALQQADAQKINSEMDALLDKLENLSQQELEKIANALENLEGINDEELAEMLDNLAQQLSSNLSQATAQGAALKGKLSALASQSETAIQNMQNLNQALASENASNKTEFSGQSGQQGDGMGQGQGEGEQSGSGQGGQGQGSGEGKNSGQGRGVGHQETEKVYSRKAEAMGGYATQLQGQQNEQGQTNITREQTIGEKGQSVPYDTVYYSYKNDALRDIENSDVPYGMRELVSEYFSTLEQ